MQTKGFFASLFDLSFSSLVTTKVIKVIYVLTLIAIGLFALALVITGFHTSAAAGVLVLLVVAPVVSLFYVVYARVLLEFVIAVFRIMETNVQLVELQRAERAPAPRSEAPPSVS